MLEHSGRFSQAGPDTLEENLDKQHFFVELERDRASPIDYSELNRQLGETGLSPLTTGYDNYATFKVTFSKENLII